jgi:hypothetical protein
VWEGYFFLVDGLVVLLYPKFLIVLGVIVWFGNGLLVFGSFIYHFARFPSYAIVEWSNVVS